MWSFIAGFMIGGGFGFLICAMISGPAIAEARSAINQARDYIALLEGQRGQN